MIIYSILSFGNIKRLLSFWECFYSLFLGRIVLEKGKKFFLDCFNKGFMIWKENNVIDLCYMDDFLRFWKIINCKKSELMIV